MIDPRDLDTLGLLREILCELQCSRFEAAERHNATVDAIAAERERCAKIAEDFTGAQHAAHDMATGVWPEQSYMGKAIASAIRKGE